MEQNGPLVIYVGSNWEGFTFRLDPKSFRALQEKTKTLNDALPTVSIGYDTRVGFESIHGPVYDHVAELLTGLSAEKLKKIGFVFKDGKTDQQIFPSRNGKKG